MGRILERTGRVRDPEKDWRLRLIKTYVSQK